MLEKRIGIYIYFKQNKFIRQLKRYGHLIYVNKEKKYLLLYIYESDLPQTIEALNGLKYVNDVLVSEYPNIKREYGTENFEPKDYRVI
ncbi:YlbG family protein [Salinicoccus sp. RF5]|uniref:YlbG family protein n=1 Tax=Salinicoccus sp. RF5 TaxID=2748874 RepID=UPI001E5D7C41|nr:YlbG family protein [Salinicoccus sp. RF5]MCC4722145.1 YlbG family protein [Salinicoccus sp. RF5]